MPWPRPSRIDFTGAHIGFVPPGTRLHLTTTGLIPVRLRAFRKIAEETKNHDLERDLYIEERKAERGVYLRQRFLDWVWNPKRKWALISHIFWIVVMSLYWALSDYGRSFLRPIMALIISGFVFYWGYDKVLAPPEAGTLDAAKYEQAVRMVAPTRCLLSAPLPSTAKSKNFCSARTTQLLACHPFRPKVSNSW